MKFDIEYIEKLSKIIADTGLTEISLEDGEQAITIRKEIVVAPQAVATAPIAQPSAATVASTAETPKVETKKGTPVVSPMVGTFYSAPETSAAAIIAGILK